MVYDDYDEAHASKFENIINIYRDSNTEDILNNYLESELLDVPDVDEYKIPKYIKKAQIIREFEQLIKRLNNALEVLDTRYFTAVSGRMISQKPRKKTAICEWNCITLYRMYKPL